GEPEGEGVDVARLPIEPEQAERVVRGAVAREAGNRHGRSGGTGQGDEARRRIRVDPEPRERARIGAHERGQELAAPTALQCREHEQLVGHNGAAHAPAQLVLRHALAERRRGDLAPFERAIAQRVGDRALRHVGAAARRRREAAARALERALTVTGSSGTAASPMRILATIRSSSAWRATLTWTAAMPRKRAVSS